MYRFSFFLFFSFFTLILQGQFAEPILRLNSGFHTAAVRSISADAEGRRLLTVSEDKTARLWDARTGNALRILRPPIGYGNEGNLYACALSPRGDIAAVGGYTGASWNKADSSRISVGAWTGYARQLKYSVYLFSTQTGDLIKNIDHLDGEIQHLCFSPDGEYLAVALAENKGIRIIRTETGAEVRRLIGYGGNLRHIAFSPSGQLASVAGDKYLRLYNKTFQLIATNPVDGNPTSVAFSADEKTIAVGYSGQSQINQYQQVDGNTYRTVVLLTPAKTSTDAVAFASNGTMYSGENTPDGKNRIVAWKNGQRTEIPAGTGKITSIHALPDGSVVYATSYPEMGRILSNHQAPLAWEGNRETAYLRTADMVALSQRQQEILQLNDDASEAGLTDENHQVLFFSLPDRELKTAPSTFPKPTNRNLRHALFVDAWKDSHEIRLNGNAIQILDKDEISRCVDISANGKYILLGTNQHLLCLNGQGKVLWKQTIVEECAAVKIAGNEKTAVIALSNGTYVWHDMSEGKQLLTLFVHPDHKRWILWTPTGFYDCSAGAEELVGWNMNQGKGKASVFFPVAQFRSSFYRPAMIDQSVGYSNTQIAQNKIEKKPEAPKAAEVVVAQPQSIALNLPPEINIVSPQSESSTSKREVRLQYSVKTQSNKPVESVRVLVDGRPVQLLPAIQAGLNEVVVEVPEKDCEITLVARNASMSSVPATVRLKWTGFKEENLFKPKLYILAVGVSKYKDKDLALHYAAKDATDFANIMAKQKGLLYGDVSIRLLIDEKSSKDNILDGLDWIQAETTARDVAMIYLAGHGINDNTDNFFYMPVEADRNRLRATCVNYVEIKQSVAAIPGKVLLFMDACHSGGVMGATRRAAADINGLVNELASAENGVVVFTSSTGRQFSMEDDSWNNGAFTKALVEGLSGEADIFKRNMITIKTLDLYISQRVKELTKGQQAPTTIIPASISDFPIAVPK